MKTPFLQLTNRIRFTWKIMPAWAKGADAVILALIGLAILAAISNSH